MAPSGATRRRETQALTVLDQIPVVGQGEGRAGILLHQEHDGPLGVERVDHVEDLFYEDRGESEGRLVQEQELRPRHQGAHVRAGDAASGGVAAYVAFDFSASRRRQRSGS